MPIKVLVNGAFGRMGQMVVQTLKENNNFQLVGQTGREYNLTKSIQDSGAQVVVDFTNAETVFANTKAIIDAGAHPVIGTSGLTAPQIAEFKNECAQLKRGGIIVPNFSLGAVLMMKCAKDIAKYFPHAEIVEFHHDKKLDSPSGTALRTAELMAEACKSINSDSLPSRETVKGSRGANHHRIPIHAVRLPGFLAHQEVIFGSPGEALTIRHDSTSRECFMPGVTLACEKVVGLNYLAYGLEEIL